MMVLHKYVPVEQSSTTVMVNGTEHIVEREKLYPICFGGDQLSAAHYQGSIVIRCNSMTPSKRLEGLIPIFEDWHTEVTLLKVGLHTCIACTCTCT